MNREKGLPLLIFALVYAYLIYNLNPGLLLTDTTTAGGDTGPHNYIAYHLKEIFPSIHGWSRDWYAGFPFMYFYPPLLYIFTALLSYIIPINVAFKLITVLGTLLLPASAYFSLRLLRLGTPVSLLGAAFSLSFLFLEAYSIYGGNLPSTLAGEFSYSFSFSLFWIFIAAMKRGIEEKKYLVLNALIMSLIVLSHLIPVIASIFVMPVLLNKKEFRFRLIYISKVYLLAFVITSFWSVPFLWYMDYVPILKSTRFILLKAIFPVPLIPFQILALMGVIYSLFKRDRKIDVLLFAVLVNFALYFMISNTKIWNSRFLPFFSEGSVLLAAYFVGNILNKVSEKPQVCLMLSILTVSVMLWTDINTRYIPDWIRWNYEGFEKKTSWKEVKPLFDYLRGLPYGRVMWEYRPEYNKYGTARVLEDIPLFSGQPTFEGLLIESALTSPFHFINQAETTKSPSYAVSGFTEYPEFNFEKGVKHLELFGTRYFIAYTKDVKEEAARYLVKLKDINQFSVYEMPDVRLIVPLLDFNVRKKNRNWLFESADWYKKDDLARPIIFVKKEGDAAIFRKVEINRDAKIVLIRFDDNRIEFDTDSIGVPHLVKVTYFPKWKVRGAKGPFLVSPAFMVVIPDSRHVVMTFD